MKKKKLIIIAVLVMATAVAVGFFLYHHYHVAKIDQPGGTVTLAPPTKQERAEANSKKDELVKQQQVIDQQNQQSGKKAVVPVITNVDQTGLNAYVSGVYEDTGTCKVTVTHGNTSFSKSSQGFEDATTVGCSAIDFSSSDFTSKGVWTATVTYDSPTATGSSKPVTFTVK